MRIGLVLGAGGSVGIAYHGAVLAALEEVTGWDPRRAEIIVGTSAGSITASMLRAGVPAGDLVRISEDLPLSEEGARLATLGRPHRPRPKPRDLLQFRLMADPLAVVQGVFQLHRHPLGGLLAALMPAGGIPTDAISRGTDAVFTGRWPEEPMWLCAVALRDGRRVVFGREGAPDATVGQAVSASSAVPGYFQPVVIGGRRYVDGGVRSPTNLDLVAGLGLDLVIVTSPLSHASGWPTLAAVTPVRQALRAQLRIELAALRRTGVPVVAIEPNRRIVQAMGINPMDARRRGAVSRVTRAEVSGWLADDARGRWLVAMLAGAGTSVPVRRPAPAPATTPSPLVAADGGLLPSA